MGGRVTQWMALDHPKRVKSMVLAASGPGEFDPNFKVTRGIPLQAAEAMIIKGYEKFIRENIAGPFLFTAGFARNNPGVVQKLADAFWDNHPPLKFYLRHVIARQQHQTAERLGEIQTPTLIIVGDDDKTTGGTGNHLRQSEYLAKQIPNTELVVIPGVAHGFFWEKPEETNRAIIKFLRKHN